VTGDGSASPVLRVVLVVAAFVVGGVLAGVVWQAVWTPPTGLYLDEQWRVDSVGAPREVSGTGLYVVVAAAAGIVLGFAVSLLVRDRELLTLGAVALGSVLAGVVMSLTGHALGPDDPRPLAAGKPDYTAEVSDLRVDGRSPYVAFPAGSLTAVAASFLLLARSGGNGPVTEPDE